MVRQVTTTAPGRRGPAALLLMALAAGGLLWHVLACVESPMSYSPDGKQLALTVAHPYNLPTLADKGKQVYRVMILPAGGESITIEETTDHMLSAPAWSPDGKTLAYLRIPLLTEDERATHKERFEALTETLKDYKSPLDTTTRPADRKPPAAGDPNQLISRAMPAPESMVDWVLALPRIGCELVLCDAATGRPQQTLPVRLQAAPVASGDAEDAYMVYTYTLGKPAFTSHGEAVVVWAGLECSRVDLDSGQQTVLAGPVLRPRLSPDGKTLACMGQASVGFRSMDDSRMTWVSLEGVEVGPSAMGWVDNDTFALLVNITENEQTSAGLMLLDAWGRSRKTVPLPTDKLELIEMFFAVLPDGRSAVIVGQHEAVVLTLDGTIQARWESPRGALAQPVVHPGGERIACKIMDSDEDGCVGIAEYDLSGKELRWTPLPRPTSQPERSPNVTLENVTVEVESIQRRAPTEQAP